MNITELAIMQQKEIERVFCACLLIDPLTVIKDGGWLAPAYIMDESIRRFWSQTKEHTAPDSTDEQVRTVSIQAALEAGVDVTMINNYDWQVLNVRAVCAEIQARANNLHIGSRLGDLARAIGQNDHEKIKRLLSEINTIDTVTGYRAYTAWDAHNALLETLDHPTATVESMIVPLDEALGGLERGTLIVIAARPSMGKSALGWQIARNVALQKKLVVFFSLEMSSRALWMRAACPIAGVDYRDVKRGRLTQPQRKRLQQESEALAGNYADYLVIDDKVHSTDTLWQVVSSLHPDMVIVDHLRLLKDKHEKEHKRLGMITERLKDLSKAYNIPVIALAQLNRGLESRQEKRPGLADLRDSGEIEENADVVIMLHRDDYYQKNGIAEKSEAELLIEKNRNGTRLGRVLLMYDLKAQWFERSMRP